METDVGRQARASGHFPQLSLPSRAQSEEQLPVVKSSQLLLSRRQKDQGCCDVAASHTHIAFAPLPHLLFCRVFPQSDQGARGRPHTASPQTGIIEKGDE